MKKGLSILIAVCMLLALAPAASAADYSLAINNNVAIMVGNNNAIAYNGIKTLPVAPIEQNGVMLAPASFVAAGFSGALTYDAATETATITMGKDRTAYLKMGYKYAVVNGRVYESDIAPAIIDGQVMVPVTFLAEKVLGKHVYYDETNKMAVITQRKCLSSRDKDAISTIANAIVSGVLPAIVIQAPVIDVTGGGMGVAVDDTNGQLASSPVGSKVALTASMLTASQTPEANNNAANLLDGNPQTAWASQGEATLSVNLGNAMTVTTVGVAMKRYEDDRVIPFDVAISADGSSYTKVWSGTSEVRSDAMQYITFSAGARFVRLTVYGSTTSGWSSVGDLEVYSSGAAVIPSGTTGGAQSSAKGSVLVAPTGNKVTLTASMLTASQTPEADNNAAKLIDGSKETVWASQGDASVVIDLGSSMTVSCVGVAMKMYEDNRIIPYDIEVSADGAGYSQIWSGSSDEMTNATKYVSVNSAARYVRITAHGNSISGWNSVAEVEVYSSGAATAATTNTTTTTTTAATAGTASSTASGTKVALTKSMLTVSQLPEPANNEDNLIDGSKETVWASQGEANVIIDLGSAKTVSSVGVAMKMYDDSRTIPYKVEVSADGYTYSEVWSGSSEMMSNSTNYINTSSSARYIRVTAYGNTVSGWNSIAELEVYTK